VLVPRLVPVLVLVPVLMSVQAQESHCKQVQSP
jgi:hypothetical protein